jgi:hypothetical protein
VNPDTPGEAITSLPARQAQEILTVARLVANLATPLSIPGWEPFCVVPEVAISALSACLTRLAENRTWMTEEEFRAVFEADYLGAVAAEGGSFAEIETAMRDRRLDRQGAALPKSA